METHLTFPPFQASGLLGNGQNGHRGSDILGDPIDVNELMIAREVEKKRIRKEIITSGLLAPTRAGGRNDKGNDNGAGKQWSADESWRPKQEGGMNWRSSSVGQRGGSGTGGMEERSMGLSRQEGEMNGRVSSMGQRDAAAKWSCTPYQVAVTCEQGLKDHLNERKHMGKAKAVLKLMAREKAKAMLTSTKTVNIDADNSEASAEETMKRRRNGHERKTNESSRNGKEAHDSFAEIWWLRCGRKNHATLTINKNNGAAAEEKEEPLCNTSGDADELANDESDAVGGDFEA
ncbi:hypothetical protein Acr_20g0000910 [Actinidia rufa]|uniref:Uncharacterized protein n=1 Tax=Actinidia rufa TaxID=165716 RepID=A0A7J0GBW9_9ERIC|nr:hypothetical protein Acr_20g0000910 [Actinidia rufa]